MKNRITNWVRLVGRVAQEPVASERFPDEECYEATLHVRRLSGIIDSIIIVADKETMLKDDICKCCKVRIFGEVQTNNKRDENGKNHVFVYVWAKEIQKVDDFMPDENRVGLSGTLRRAPEVKYSKRSDKYVTDFVLRASGTRPYYFFVPCMAWNNVANTLGRLEEWAVINFIGRFQSREFLRTSATGEEEEGIAYEVSVMELI